MSSRFATHLRMNLTQGMLAHANGYIVPHVCAVEDVNNCVGRHGGSAASMAPGAVPRRCAAAAQRLQNCLEEQQRLQEAAAAAR